jgi:1,4-alpha-glucan branching enzyme
VALPESSWGAGGTHFTWDNPDTHWMWEPIHAAERRMEALVARYLDFGSLSDFRNLGLRDALNQAARELLLLQSSDWPFLVTTGQARAYSIERFQSHVERFNVLADMLEAGAADAATVRQYHELDNPFPDIDYRDFGRREP